MSLRQIEKGDCHFKVILCEPILYLEGALVHFFGFAMVFELIVRGAQVVQSDTNVVRIITEFAPEDVQVIILF